MASRNPTIRTIEALRLASLDSKVWHGSMSHRLYREAPPNGADGRRFALDDVIALALFRELMAFGLTRTYAAGIASDIRAVMRTHPDIDAVSVIKGAGKDGTPCPVVVVTPPLGAVPLLGPFSIGLMRAALEAPFTALAS